MTTSEIVKVINQKTGLDQRKIKNTLDYFQEIIAREMALNHEIQIPGFGNFVLVNYPSRMVRHPQDSSKKLINLPVNVPKFRPDNSFSKIVNQSKQNWPQGKPKEVVEETPDQTLASHPTGSFVPYADLSKYIVPKKILAQIPEHIARRWQAVPLEEKNGKLVVAMSDPEDREAIEFIKKKTGRQLDLRICTRSDINHILDQYSGLSGELKQIVQEAEGEGELKIEKEDETKKETIETAPAAKIVQTLIRRAVREKASDIHIEPTEEEIIVRFRIDGVLRKIITLPKELLPAVVSRIKILAGLKIDETRLPQDGRFQFTIDQSEVDFRISTMPTVNGEKVVGRLLDKSSGILTLEQLGLRGSAFTILEDNIHKSHGMILVTGPTGSGKTTTLYAIIKRLMNERVNIVTLEDPVEYRIPSINQSQIHPAINYTFANGLRSILRQDPDLIMVGEIRDYETADMAIHSALTGHIVLSTLHTNNAAGAVPRLIDMKIEPFLINSSLNAVVAQRLCRKICEECRQKMTVDPANLEAAQKEIAKLPPNEKKPTKIEFYQGRGCNNCGSTGYQGRAGIFEVFNLTNNLKELVAKRSSATSLEEQAIKNGMTTLKQDGILKALDGIITLDEVWRVTKE